jgi:hypothetical protein
MLEEIIIKVCSKYDVDGFRNVGTFLSFYPLSSPRKGNKQSRCLENIGSRIIDVAVSTDGSDVTALKVLHSNEELFTFYDNSGLPLKFVRQFVSFRSVFWCLFSYGAHKMTPEYL